VVAFVNSRPNYTTHSRMDVDHWANSVGPQERIRRDSRIRFKHDWLPLPVPLLPAAGSADDHRLAVMGEPVQSGAGQEASAKHIWQLTQAAVTGEAGVGTTAEATEQV